VIRQETQEILYTVRAAGDRFQPRVYAPGRYTVKAGADRPDTQTWSDLEPRPASDAGELRAQI
jgi:hypothetical protein